MDSCVASTINRGVADRLPVLKGTRELKKKTGTRVYLGAIWGRALKNPLNRRVPAGYPSNIWVPET